MIGQILGGRYKLITAMFPGAMAHTFLAEDLQRPGHPKCVVKQLKPSRTDPGFLSHARSLFEREAKTLTELGAHNQIPQLLAHFEEDENFYLAMEFIEGYTLSAELEPGNRWSEAQVIAMLTEILEILSYVHERNVIHRDIKPANIIRRLSDHKLVLIDFGAVSEVKAHFSALVSSPATKIVGTFGYMPTEQAQGNPRYNSDLYALGLLAIQALTGLLPTQLPQDANTGEIVWQQFLPVSEPLSSILSKMVRYHFKDRYQSAKEVLTALYAISQPEPDENSFFGIDSLIRPQQAQNILINDQLPTTVVDTNGNSSKAKTQIPQRIVSAWTPVSSKLKDSISTLSASRDFKWIAGAFGASAAFVTLSIIVGLVHSIANSSSSIFGGDSVLNVGLLATSNNPPEDYSALLEHFKSKISQKYGPEVGLELDVLAIDETTSAISEASQNIKSKSWDLAFTMAPQVSVVAVENGYEFAARMWPDIRNLSTVTYVKADSPIQSLDDINAESTLALGGFDSGAFFYVPIYDLYGKTVKVDLNNSLNTIAQKVKNGQADVGVGLNFQIANNPDFRIIAQSRQIPDAGVFISPKLDTRERQWVQATLLEAPENMQKAAQYEPGEVPDYSDFIQIINRVEEVTGCRNWQQNPVPLYCEVAQPSDPQNFSWRISGDTNGMKYLSNNYQYLLKASNGEEYQLIIPQAVFSQDPELPAPFELAFKSVKVSSEIIPSKQGEVMELRVIKPGQLQVE